MCRDCGKQVYLGGFDTVHVAARAYDRAAIKFRGVDADINFNVSDYDEDIKQVVNYEVRSLCIFYGDSALVFQGEAPNTGELLCPSAGDGTKEGGRGPSVWDTFTHKYPDKIKDGSNSDIAIGSYHH
ncbi:hypothetical protein JHK82_031066 [Glycine max]|nr:hypothetical protein JHK82_031066 [Glycine max]